MTEQVVESPGLGDRSLARIPIPLGGCQKDRPNHLWTEEQTFLLLLGDSDSKAGSGRKMAQLEAIMTY